MKAKEYTILLDAYKGVLNPQDIVLVTDDNGQYILKFKLLIDKITAYDLTGCLVRLATNADQQQDCTITSNTDGEVNITLLQSMFSKGGTITAEIQVYDSSNQTLRLTFPQFKYYVRKSLMNDGTVKADPAFTLLQNMIINISNANTTATQALSTAIDALTMANQAEMQIGNQIAKIDSTVANVEALRDEMTPFLGDLADAKTKLVDVADGATRDVFVTDGEMPIVANRLKNTFYWHLNADLEIDYVEDWLGNRTYLTSQALADVLTVENEEWVVG